MKGTGLLLNDSYDLQIRPERDANGKIKKGWQVGETLYQNQAVILMAQPGEIKENPIIGVGIGDVVLDTDFLAWRKRIREQMELDGQQVSDVRFNLDKNLEIDADYTS